MMLLCWHRRDLTPPGPRGAGPRKPGENKGLDREPSLPYEEWDPEERQCGAAQAPGAEYGPTARDLPAAGV